MDVKAVVGRNVQQHREAHGLSAEQRVFEADLHRTYVSAVERGIRNPKILFVAKPANAPGRRSY